MFIVTITAARPQGESGRAARKDRSVNDASEQCQRRAANKAAFTSPDVVDVPILGPVIFGAGAGAVPASALETPAGLLVGAFTETGFDATGRVGAAGFTGGEVCVVAVPVAAAGVTAAFGSALGWGFGCASPGFFSGFVEPVCGLCRRPIGRSARSAEIRSLAKLFNSSFVTD